MFWITVCSWEILYESAPYHNAVLVGLDEQGQAKYAFLRGIYDSRGKNFKMEQEGSDKQYSFCVPPLGKSSRVAVYEACIDALAHMTLEDGRTDEVPSVSRGHCSTKRRSGTSNEEDETSRCIGTFPKRASGGDRN